MGAVDYTPHSSTPSYLKEVECLIQEEAIIIILKHNGKIRALGARLDFSKGDEAMWLVEQLARAAQATLKELGVGRAISKPTAEEYERMR